MRSSIKITLSLAGALVTIAVVILTSFWAFGQIVAAAEVRSKTSGQVSLADGVLLALVDAETSQRGYVLTGDPTYLEPYFLVIGRTPGMLADLRTNTPPGKALVLLDQMDEFARAKMLVVSTIVDYYQRHGQTQGLVLAPGPKPKALMDSFRVAEAGYRADRLALLSKNEQELQSSMAFLLASLGALCLVLVACSLLTAYFVHQDRSLVETRQRLERQARANLELTKANVSLQASEEKLAVTLNSIGDAVLTTDAQGRVTMLNPQAEILTGWTNADAGGLPVETVFQIIGQTSRKPLAVPVMETLANGTVTGLANHTVMISRRGGERAIADSCSPIRDQGGEVIGAVLVFRDVTAEYATQQAVVDGASFVKSILNTVADGVITFHAEDGVIETVNPAALGMLGYDEADLVGLVISRVVPELVPEKMVGNPLDGNSAWELTGRRQDGSTFPLELMVTELISGGRRLFTGLFRDITLRREAERALEKTHGELRNLTVELERSARAKSDFLANMSHELRTPLNSINGFSEVLFDETFGPLNEKQKKYVNNVLTSGQHLLLLINQILDMTKVESGKTTLTLKRLPFRKILQEIADLIADSARKKNLELLLGIPEDLPDIVADELKVKEVLYNLLSNVVKFTPPDGWVGLNARIHGAWVEVEVWDTGIGVAAENLPRVFEGFFRVESPLSQVTEGTGLGLPLSKKLVELHGGSLKVESDGLNCGTVVRFTLPLEATA